MHGRSDGHHACARLGGHVTLLCCTESAAQWPACACPMHGRSRGCHACATMEADSLLCCTGVEADWPECARTMREAHQVAILHVTCWRVTACCAPQGLLQTGLHAPNGRGMQALRGWRLWLATQRCRWAYLYPAPAVSTHSGCSVFTGMRSSHSSASCLCMARARKGPFPVGSCLTPAWL